MESRPLTLNGHLLAEIPSGSREVYGNSKKKLGNGWFNIEVSGDLQTATEKYLVKYDPERGTCWATNCGINPNNHKPYFSDSQPFIVLVGNLLFQK